MEPEMFAVIAFAVFFLVCFIRFFFTARNLSVTMGLNVTPISTEDFQRLLEKEESPTVFYTKIPFGGYYYFATVGQDRICTRSKQELGFPAKCDLIPLKRI